MAKYNPHFDASTWSRSCKEEIVSPIYGKVTGFIPSWLNGVLIRNGPGLYHFGNTEMSHMFDGMALLHRFEIQDGVASYQCRFIQSDTYKKNTKANRIVVTDFGTTAVPDPCQSIFHRISSSFNFNKNMPDNAVISVYPFGDQIYAFSETAVMYRVNHKNLETIRKIDCKERFGVITHSSHPQVLKMGNVYNLGLSFSSKGPQYLIVCFPRKQKNDENDYSMFDKAHIVASIPSRWKLNPSYMHSFGITENYFIIIEQPISLSISTLLLAKVFADAPASKFIKWHKNQMTRFMVVSRQTGELRKKFYAKGFFYFHTINQYEHFDHIVIDICMYDDCSILNSTYLEALKNARMDPNFASTFKSYPTRFVLPLSVAQHKPFSDENLVRIPNTNAKAYIDKNSHIFVESELICDTICDMPTIFRDEFLGKDYQYFYGVNQCTADTNPSALVKVDVKNKTCKSWLEKHCYPSEPIFVPKPNNQGEDDGVVLSSLIWGENENRVSLLVLDAKTFEELGRVEFETEGPVPRTLHGWYLPK